MSVKDYIQNLYISLLVGCSSVEAVAAVGFRPIGLFRPQRNPRENFFFPSLTL